MSGNIETEKEGYPRGPNKEGLIGTTLLSNSNEDIVKTNVRKLMSLTDICKCEKCFNDVCAIVLNKIKPRYVTTHKGNLLSQIPQMSAENQEELTIYVAQAIKLVSESPQH